MNSRILWIGKTGNANAWYHIYPYVKSKKTKRIIVVRQEQIERNIDDKKLQFIYFKNLFYLNELWNYFWTGQKVLIKNKFDFIVSSSLVPWGVISWLLAKIHNKKIVLGLIGSDFNKNVKNGLLSPILRYILKRTDIITVTGDKMHNELKDIIGCENRIFILPHCLPDSLILKNDRFARKANVLITVSDLTENKRTIDIIKSVGILKEKGINIKLLVVGQGPLEMVLKDYVTDNDLSHNITFLGYVNKIKEVYKKADIFIQASLKEGLSLCLVEAIGMELVPIVTNAGCEMDIVSNEKNGLFFRKKDVFDLVEKIKFAMIEENYKNLRSGVKATKKNLQSGIAIKVVEDIQNQIIKRP